MLDSHAQSPASGPADTLATASWSDEARRTQYTELTAEMVGFAQALAHKSAWTTLARSAIEPNPYYEPDHLAALDEHILTGKDIKILMVWEKSGTESRLSGLFPLTSDGLKKGFAPSVSAAAFDSLVGICTPLIAPQNPQMVWKAALEYLTADGDTPRVMYFKEFYVDGPAGRALKELVARGDASMATEHSFARAIAHADTSFEYYKARWSGKKGRNIRTRRKKLEEMGAVDFTIVKSGTPGFAAVLDETLALEKSGWKGREGTALASNPATEAFAKTAYCSNAQQATHIATMRLDGRLIAAQINLIAQDQAYFIKSGYDESLSKLGPGVILYTWVLEQALDHGLYRVLDSCADAGHPLEEIWLESKTVCGLAVVSQKRGATQAQLDRLLKRRKMLKTARLWVRRLFRR